MHLVGTAFRFYDIGGVAGLARRSPGWNMSRFTWVADFSLRGHFPSTEHGRPRVG